MLATQVLGAISFDPNIRGVLIVLTGTVVLMGSVFMILATNSGARVGFMLAASGLFGWLAILGLLWTINPGGLKGRDAAWMPAEINYNRTDDLGKPVPVATPQLASLPVPDTLADPQALLESKPLLHALALGAEGKDYQPKTLTKLKTLISPWVVIRTRDAAALARKALDQAGPLIAENPDVAVLLNAQDDSLRDEIRKESIDLRRTIDEPFGDWCLITESDPRRGNAVSSADAMLAHEQVFGSTTSQADYIVGDVWFYGGREPCTTLEERANTTRVWERLVSIAEPKQPELLSAVTLVKATPVTVAPGQAPPSPTPQDGASTMTVVQRWNYGNVRFVPFVFFLLNLTLFGVFAYLLHARDKLAMAARAEWSGGTD